jgi:subtilisin family serine protease
MAKARFAPRSVSRLLTAVRSLGAGRPARPYLAGLTALCAAILLSVGFDAGARRPGPPSIAIGNEKIPTAIAGQYIVIFKQNVRVRPGQGIAHDRVAVAQSLAAEAVARRLGARIDFTYRHAVIGFAARLSAGALAAVRAMPGVAVVEPDQRAELASIQLGPPLGLDRLSERIGMDGKYSYSLDGSGVHAYVIDSGIHPSHAEFAGTSGNRVGTGYWVVGTSAADCHGHGTHVAGSIGGLTWGVAKNVRLHPVRVLDCNAWGTAAGVVQAIDWLIWNAQRPAVANVSLRFWPDAVLDTAVDNAVSSGITFVVAAANDGGDACQVSPARAPAAITVGSIDPLTDMKVPNSNFGPCVDIFAPGGGIESASLNGHLGPPGSISSGTSMAAPHVVGVAALYLQTTLPNAVAATPGDVWNAIDNAASIPGTSYNWAGIPNRGAGSPDKLLHWGSGSSDGYMDGDPHLQTVDGIRYDLQGAGEYVYLRESGGIEVQIRHTPIATAVRPPADPYDGLAMCASLNTAVAARVGTHRVTLQPSLDGVHNHAGLELRIDGVLTSLPAAGVAVGSATVKPSSTVHGIEIHYPNGAVLVATPGWFASHNMWWISVDLLNTTAREGLLGSLAPGSWLPRLPNGGSVGPMPATAHQRYVTLYQQFAAAWRVTGAGSLFDYRAGMSTANFTNPAWPVEQGPCVVPPRPRFVFPRAEPVKPAPVRIAREVCRPVRDKGKRASCEFDVAVTADTSFGRHYQLIERAVAEIKRRPLREREDRPLERDP